MTELKSLWGEIPTPTDLPNLPVKILKEQGAVLTEATSGSLIGEVSYSGQKGTSFSASLRIKVPALNNYLFQVLSIVYPIKLYPLRVATGIYGQTKVVTCTSVDEYEEALASILTSKEVRSIIEALLAQVTSEDAMSA